MKTPPLIPSVVKREDKLTTLRTFIIAALLKPRTGTDSGVVTLVARSAESPVARALVTLSADLVSRGLTIRAVFAQLEPEKTSAGWSISSPDIGFGRDLRWAKNTRLSDAHEQLVLPGTACWTGDCMRRDPALRDAYEQFSTNDAATARHLQISFERLWAASVPLSIRTQQSSGPIARPTGAADEALAVLALRDDNSGPLASSSH